jgi:indolepyruvate ferredoxin oxidoreductase alpha subunit
VLGWYDEVLVLEEPAPVIEMQLLDRYKVRGKATGAVPQAGELLPEIIEGVLYEFAKVAPPSKVKRDPAAPGRRPTLCAGCPHRASFYAIREAAPEGIYTSDIGCYTLGLNLGAVETVLCMGAAVGQAAGFRQAYNLSGKEVDVVATIGDSTLFHAGLPGLIDSVVQGVNYVLVVLDNSVTAMTGLQPTPATGKGVCGEKTGVVDIEGLVRACGIGFCKVGIPGRFEEFKALVKEALAYSRENGPAVIIAREPCRMSQSCNERATARSVVSGACTGCGNCISRFGCPAISLDKESGCATISETVCVGCGVCRHVCRVGAIGMKKEAVL